MPQTIPDHAPLLSATCLHAVLFPVFPGLAVPECPPCPILYTNGQANLQPHSPQKHCETPLINLPLSPQEARACLAELRSLDAESLAQQLRLAVANMCRVGLPAHEAAALAQFSSTSATSSILNISKNTDSMVSEQARRRQAQTLLLMTWVQEERLLDIAELSRRCERSEKKLAALLHEGSETADPTEQPLAPDTQKLALLPGWEFVLEQLCWFLPENTVFCVTHPDLATRLHESGRLESYGEGLVGARFRLSELSRRFNCARQNTQAGKASQPSQDGSEHLFILPHKVLA